MNESKNEKRAVDEIMQRARVGGVAVQGQFSMDAAVAREKMKAFRLEDPWAYAVEFFLAAVRKDATSVEMNVEAGHFEMSFDGKCFTARDFENMYGDCFAGNDAAPEHRAAGQWALALNAISAFEPYSVAVVSSDGEHGARLVVRHGKEGVIESLDATPPGTYIHAAIGIPPGMVVMETDGRAKTIGHLKRSCLYTACALKVNGESISQGFDLPEASIQVPFEDESLRALAGVVPGNAAGKALFIVEGVHVETVPLPDDCRGTVVLLTDTRFQKDISAAKIIRGEVFDAAIQVARVAARQALDRIRTKSTELHFFLGGNGNTPEDTVEWAAGVSFENRRAKETTIPKNFQPPFFYVSPYLRLRDAQFEFLKKILRPVVKAMYFSWLLLIPKLIGRLVSPVLGAWATVSFVLLAVVFFALLAFTAFFYVVVGPKSKRRRLLELHPNRYKLDEAAAMRGLNVLSAVPLVKKMSAASEKRMLRVVGTIAWSENVGADDRDVYTDRWAPLEDGVARLQSSRQFCLKDETRLETEITVDLSDGVWIEGPYKPSGGVPTVPPSTWDSIGGLANKALTQLSGRAKKSGYKNEQMLVFDVSLHPGRGISIREGDRLEIFAPSGTWTVSEKGTSGEQQKGVMIVGEKSNPLLVRILSQSGEAEGTT